MSNTFELLDIVAGKPAGGFAQSALPPAALFALRHRDNIAFLEAQLVIVLAFERVDRLHHVRVVGHLAFTSPSLAKRDGGVK